MSCSVCSGNVENRRIPGWEMRDRNRRDRRIFPAPTGRGLCQEQRGKKGEGEPKGT